MNYSTATEWARPYIDQLKKWIQKNRIRISYHMGPTERIEQYLIHPAASDEELLEMCLPYFSQCHNCKFSACAHPMIETGKNTWLHLCTKMAIVKGIVPDDTSRRNKK